MPASKPFIGVESVNATFAVSSVESGARLMGNPRAGKHGVIEGPAIETG